MVYDGVDFSYWWIVSCAFIATLVLLDVVGPLIFQAFSTKYSTFDESTKGELRTLFVSGCHSVVVSTGCLYTMWFGGDDTIFSDNIWGSSHVVQTCMAIVIGYMIADYIILWRYFKKSPDLMFFGIHHAASIIAYAYSMMFHVCLYFSNYRLLAELSTPFVNLRRLMEIFGYPKTGPLYVANGWTLALSFFLARIAIFPHYYYKLYSVFISAPMLELDYTRYVLLVASLALDSLNVVWFYKICRGAFKIVRIQLKGK